MEGRGLNRSAYPFGLATVQVRVPSATVIPGGLFGGSIGAVDPEVPKFAPVLLYGLGSGKGILVPWKPKTLGVKFMIDVSKNSMLPFASTICWIGVDVAPEVPYPHEYCVLAAQVPNIHWLLGMKQTEAELP